MLRLRMSLRGSQSQPQPIPIKQNESESKSDHSYFVSHWTTENQQRYYNSLDLSKEGFWCLDKNKLDFGFLLV